MQRRGVDGSSAVHYGRRPVKRRRAKRRWPLVALVAVLVLAVVAAVWLLWPKKWYTAKHFGIETIVSPYDANGNGVDDFTDIVLGARADAKNRPTYDPAYFEGGYPPDDAGVCSDVIWRAFRAAGYELKDLIDADIAAEPSAYPRLDEGRPDPNIDFRRVKNLQVFFLRYAQSLTLDITDTAQWQPGDIVVFEGKTDHIGIISDRRNEEGIPWLIHNSGQWEREEDAFARLLEENEIIGHFRWYGI